MVLAVRSGVSSSVAEKGEGRVYSSWTGPGARVTSDMFGRRYTEDEELSCLVRTDIKSKQTVKQPSHIKRAWTADADTISNNTGNILTIKRGRRKKERKGRNNERESGTE